MRFSLSRQLVRVLLWLCFAIPPAVAQPIPVPTSGEDEFVAHMAGRIARATGVRVEQPASLTLKLSSDGKEILTAHLGRLWAACQRVEEKCPDFAARYVAGVASAVREQARPLDKEALRITVRPITYVESIDQGEPETAPITREFVGDLVMVLVVDGARTIRPASRSDLDALKLTEDEAFDVAKDNLRKRELKPLKAVLKTVSGKTIERLEENAYESSRLVLHEDWREYVDKVGGNLIVTVPSANLLLYGIGQTLDQVDAMGTLAREAARKSARPLSTTIFRWSYSGWQVLR